MDDARLVSLTYGHQRAVELFNSICSKKSSIPMCSEHHSILVPIEGMDLIPNDLALRYVAAERVDILFATIDIQFELASQGDERVKHIVANKKDLTDVFGDDEIVKGLNLDVGQQSCDMAIMASLSHSALQFAQQYAKNQVERLLLYQDKVFDMLRRYKQQSDYFKITKSSFSDNRTAMENYEFPDQDLSSYIQADPMKGYVGNTEEVYELNVMLAQMCLRRLENGVRALHYWKEGLGGELLETEKTGCEIYDKYCAPKHEWEYEMQLQENISQRVGILVTRSQKIGQLIDKVKPYMG